MTSFEDVDTDKNGSIEKSEWDKLLLDDKRMQIEDENSKRDQQRKMVWFSLAGLLLYPIMIIICNVLGQKVAADNLTAIAPTYCIAVVGIVTAFFGFTNIKKKDDY
jgi:ribonucleotide reductase alpha subunit|tara:strand:+ start:605 stop:922 length:318 start_codon:yes stop_codon:yes gene_type:complete